MSIDILVQLFVVKAIKLVVYDVDEILCFNLTYNGIMVVTTV